MERKLPFCVAPNGAWPVERWDFAINMSRLTALLRSEAPAFRQSQMGSR